MTKSVTNSHFNARINENGRIVIPAAIREQMGLKAGEAVVMEIEDGILRIESHRAHIRRIQQEFRQSPAPGSKLAPQQLITEQLIEDRREDASQEMEQWLG
jgi:AbrB family looped-hinge helix DNA binding protein